LKSILPLNARYTRFNQRSLLLWHAVDLNFARLSFGVDLNSRICASLSGGKAISGDLAPAR
jgi:hypothetical protein